MGRDSRRERCLARRSRAPDRGRTAVAPAAPQISSWREVVALASGRQPLLHAHLVHSVHPVHVAPGRIEIRPRPDAPRDLAQQIVGLLQQATGTRWTVSLVGNGGERTLAEQGRAVAVVSSGDPGVFAMATAVLEEAKAVGANARVATADLGTLRAEVETSLRNIDQLIGEVNRKWPFARDTELKLP